MLPWLQQVLLSCGSFNMRRHVRSDHTKATGCTWAQTADTVRLSHGRGLARMSQHLCSWLSWVMRSDWGLMGVPPSTFTPELRLPTAPTSTGSGPSTSDSA